MRVLSLVLLAFVATAILSVAHAATPAPNGVTSITVQFTIRDHVGVYSSTPAGANRTTHRDFERVIATETGVVLKNLGNDRKPVFDTSRVSTTWTNSTLFDQVWRDTPGVNINLVRNFVLTWNTDSALYEYSNLNFFPIDGAGYGNYGSTGHNFHFCLEYHTQFQYRGVESFSFTGDDDVYFFVNNILFVDLGGVHGTQSQSRDLRNTTAAKLAYNMDVNGVYNFDLFYCERHTSASNLVMATNILLNDCPYLDRCGLCTTTAPVSTVNPCLSLNCNNGVCSCPNASCICNAGWIDSPPSGNTTNYCAQKCGDGILQGDEQCDPPTLACCTSTCKFASLGTSCPSSGQACVQNICPGNAARCGVPLPVGSLCSGGSTPPACKQYQCTSADGSTCALVNNNTLTCSDNSACTTDTCVNGACISSTTTTCPSTSCRNAGTCDANTGSCSLGTAKSNGLGCGADPGLSFCVQPTCQSGSCVNTSKPLGTSCGADTPNKCGTSQCDGAGTCRIVPIASATGTTANCTPPPGSCLTSICDTQGSTNCVTVALQDGTSCTNSSLAPNSCQRLGCTAGVCGYLAINEGSSCADGAPLQAFGNDACSRKICQSGSCNVVPNSNLDGNSCNVGSGANPEPYCRVYTCTTGVCQASSVNESKACSGAGSPNNCQQQLCVSGQCSIVPANTGGQCAAPQNNSCALSRCDNAGVCQRVNTPSGVSCNATDLCNLGYCDGNGACAYPSPVVCDPVACFGNLKCDPATGVCGATGCCGDNHIDAGEDCDNTSNPCCVDCHYQAANVPCGLTNECDDKRCVNVSSTPVTICQSNTAVKENNDCTSALPPSNQCQQLKCRSGVCQAVDKADDSSCELGGVGFCAKAACVSGTCDIVANPVRTGTDCSSAYGTVPECNQATCQGTQCVLSSTNDGLACTSLDSRECSDRRCSSGSCQYDFTNYPQSPRSVCTGVSTSNVCLLPGCDGSGNCIFLNTSAGTDCDIPSNPECNLPKCDGAGVCRLVPINIGSACTTSRDLQCQEAKCDVNGNCVVANLTDNTDCSRTDVGQCQDAKCIGGACVLVNTADGSRRCAATSTAAPGEDRSCLDYFCQVADGSCDTPVPKTDNTDCTDLNLCDSDSCTAGVCIHTPSKVCNAPTQPCESPLGTCLSAYGNCTYAGRGQYASCTPRDSELDPRCNASVVGAYRCSTGSPDSPCVPACFAGGVCGDGIVQAGEECDWGDERTGGPCCNLTCMWFADQSPCNNTDATIIATQAAQAANLSASTDLPLYCFNTRCFLSSSTGKSVCSLGYDETVSPSCVPSNDKSSNRTAILASVIPGALLALCLAALGFFFWRRAQKAAEGEWLQEYLNSGNVRVENNAAFVETQNNVNNAAFQPDGNN